MSLDFISKAKIDGGRFEGTRFLEKLDIGTNVLSFGIKKLLNNLLDHELPSLCRRLAAQSGREERWMVAGWFVQYIFLFFFPSFFLFLLPG